MLDALYADKRIQNASNPKKAASIASNILWNNMLDLVYTERERYFKQNHAHKTLLGWKDDEYNQKLEYDLYKKDSIDLTKDFGYNFKGPNTPEIRMSMYRNLPCGTFGFYNNKAYEYAIDAITAYEHDLYNK
jgi:hypothetical protein